MIKKYLPRQWSLKKTSYHDGFSHYFFYVLVASLLLRIFFIGSNELLAEEAYYWNYANHLDFGYLDHPPMVAVLIRIPTMIFGSHEFFVRLATLFCWLLTAFFSYKLTNSIKEGTGLYSVILLAILPFFFLHSLVITPDMPLTACWSGALYYLFRALVLDESNQWYTAGIWLGLGMLSKYTIVLLGPAVLLYFLFVPKARQWFFRKEPYLCLLIVFMIFTPVIYWNATHEWVSFLFQSTRRFKSAFSFSAPEYLGLLFLFLMPLGVLGLFNLFKTKVSDKDLITTDSKFFLQLFTLVPLLFFGVFSLSHGMKFNWIGPGLLAIIPWLAIHMVRSSKTSTSTNFVWFITAVILLFSYSVMMFFIEFGNSERFNKTAFKKFISWRDLTEQFNSIAKDVAFKTHSTPIFVPLDLYNLNSELSYYQSRLLVQGAIEKSYPIEGCHIFGGNSLMYRNWSHNKSLAGKTLILISIEPQFFNIPSIINNVIKKSEVKYIWSHSQGGVAQIKPYYYQVVQMKS